MKFYATSNNGVRAVITEETYKRFLERARLFTECKQLNMPLPQLPPIRPVFTFSSRNHPSFPFMTGSLECIDKIWEGCDIKHGREVNVGIYVPFSNGTELGGNPEEQQRWEWMMMTSLDEAIEAFDLVPKK
ncbi:MAG: hypothetical protein Q8P91_02010 [bacterium]|nr:hypothetical protein [bacterium]